MSLSSTRNGRLAITGGRGRLAPLVADYFSRRGWAAELFSREAGPGLSSLDDLITRKITCDAVVHCAWSTVPLTAEQDPGFAERSDLPLLRRLQEALPVGVPLVFLSTAAVYGNTGIEPATESRQPAPLGHYARGKLAAEALVAEAGGTILRVTNLIGERPNPGRPQGVVPRLVRAACAGETVTIWGDGSATKDYVHCSDFLQALGEVLEQRLSGIYNVSSGVSISLRDLIGVVELETGRPVPVTTADAFAWDVSFSKVSSEKLACATGWRATRPPVEAVKDYLRQVNA